MANEENFVTVTFKEGPLGTNTEENVLPPEADSEKPKSETEMPNQSSENQAGHDTGTLTLRHSDKKSPVTSELCGILHNEAQAQAKQAVPTSTEEEILTEQSFRGFRIDFPLQVILELGEMLPGPVTSLVVGCSSESETVKSPVKSPQHQPLADNFVQPDQLDSSCHNLPSVTAPPVVQHEATLLNGISDIEPQIQPEPVVEDEQPNYSISPKEVISELEEMLSNHVASPAEVLSEVDESPDVDETNVPDGLSDPQFSMHQSAAINYIRDSQLQSNGLKLPSVTTPLLRRNVMGNSFSRSIIHYPELLAARQDEYYPKSNLSNPQLPLIRRTSVPASSSAFGKPPGWFPSEQTGYTYQLPESWESCIPTGVQAAADRMRNSANSYSTIHPLAGQKRPRVTEPHLADQVSSNGFPKIDMSGSDCPLATRPNQQDFGPQSLIPSFPPPFGFSGSPFPFPNFEVTQPSSDSEGYSSSSRHFEVNGTRQGSVPNLAPDIPSQFAHSQIVSNPTQNHSNVHLPGHANSLAPLNFNTRARRVSLLIPNTLYDNRYEQLGLPIDPIMRAFIKYERRNDDNNNLG